MSFFILLHQKKKKKNERNWMIYIKRVLFTAWNMNAPQKHTRNAQKVTSESIAHLSAELVFWLDSFTIIMWSVSEQPSLRALNSPEVKCDWEQRECVRTPFSQGLSELPLLFLSACSEVWLPAGNKTRLHHHPCTRNKVETVAECKNSQLWASTYSATRQKGIFILTKH